MFAIGIQINKPSVHILGTSEDWQQFVPRNHTYYLQLDLHIILNRSNAQL